MRPFSRYSFFSVTSAPPSSATTVSPFCAVFRSSTMTRSPSQIVPVWVNEVLQVVEDFPLAFCKRKHVGCPPQLRADNSQLPVTSGGRQLRAKSQSKCRNYTRKKGEGQPRKACNL